MFLLYSSIGVQNSTLEKYPAYRRHALREKKKKRIAPQSAAADGAGRKAAKAQRIGNYSFALACGRQAQQSLFQLYFYSISLFISRSAAESISILFPLYFQFGTLYLVPGTSIYSIDCGLSTFHSPLLPLLFH